MPGSVMHLGPGTHKHMVRSANGPCKPCTHMSTGMQRASMQSRVPQLGHRGCQAGCACPCSALLQTLGATYWCCVEHSLSITLVPGLHGQVNKQCSPHSWIQVQEVPKLPRTAPKAAAR